MSLRSNDLKNCVFPFISIDEYAPKLGSVDEVIVVAFYAKEREHAEDLNTYIQRGYFDIKDSDVSTSPDELGRYLVFVEFERNSDFFTVLQMFLNDIDKLVGETDWQVKPYLSDGTYSLYDPILRGFVITTPDDYMEKAEFMKSKAEEDTLGESIGEFLQPLGGAFSIDDDDNLFIRECHSILRGQVLDFGDFDKLNRRHNLTEHAIDTDPHNDVTALQNMLKYSWNVYLINNTVVLEHRREDKLIILSDLERVYNRA